jgi:hypothetical protein
MVLPRLASLFTNSGVTDYHLKVVGMLDVEQLRHKRQACLNYREMIAQLTAEAQN